MNVGKLSLKALLFTMIERAILQDNPIGGISHPLWCFFPASTPGFTSPIPDHASLTMTAGPLAIRQGIAPSPCNEVCLGPCLSPSPQPWSSFEWNKQSLGTVASRPTWILKHRVLFKSAYLLAAPGNVSFLRSPLCPKTGPGHVSPSPSFLPTQDRGPVSHIYLIFHLCSPHRLPCPTLYVNYLNLTPSWLHT